jgi:hypothetical protein
MKRLNIYSYYLKTSASESVLNLPLSFFARCLEYPARDSRGESKRGVEKRKEWKSWRISEG